MRKNAMEKHWIGNGQLCIRKTKNENKKQWIKKEERLFFLVSGNLEISGWFRSSRMPEVRSLILLAFPS